MNLEEEAAANKKWMEESKASLEERLKEGTLGAMADHPYALWFQGTYLPTHENMYRELLVRFHDYWTKLPIRAAAAMRFQTYLDLWLYMPDVLRERLDDVRYIIEHWSTEPNIYCSFGVKVSLEHGPVMYPHHMLQTWEERIPRWHSAGQQKEVA